jgi:hypothetical protein
MAGPDPAVPETPTEPEEPQDAREAWLSFALADVDGGAGALATAARGGRPLPKRDDPAV